LYGKPRGVQIRREHRRLGLVAWLVFCSGSLGGCSAEISSDSWSSRPAAVIHLVDRSAQIAGEARSDELTLVRWEGEELERWHSRADSEGVWLVAPRFEEGLDAAGEVEIELVPGSARRLDMIPIVAGDEYASEAMRRVRRIEVPLEQDLAPDTALRIRADVTETIHGNWGDAARGGQLVGLELRLIGAEPERVRLRSVTLESRGGTHEPFAARAAVAELGGRLHPSWWVRGGASAEFLVELPDAQSGEVELVWYDAGLEGAGSRCVEILSGDDSSFSWRSEDTEGWRVQRVSLTPWAAETLRIRLSTEGEGVGLFGDPRIVGGASGKRADSVLVYLIDALRADHVGAFGAPFPGISPTIDGLAAEGVAFHMALSHSPWTKPSIATLLTGLLPTTHRVGSRTLSDRLPASVAFAQERFRHAGWRTGSFSANPLGSTLSGLERGFGTAVAPRHWRGRSQLGRHPAASQVHAELLGWIDEEPDRPFFAYAHVMEVHPQGRARLPRARPPGYTSYASAVRAADADLGALLDSLADRGLDSNLLLVVVADHGESFGEHGAQLRGHGTSLFQDQIHVPLVFWSRAGLRSGAVTDPVGLADVAPTLLDLFGLSRLEEAEGGSLAAHLRGEAAEPRSIPSALLRFPHAADAPQQFSLVSHQGVKALRVGAERFGFDLRNDPHETDRLEVRADATQLELERRIESYPTRARDFRERHGVPHVGTVDSEQMRRLRALGYVP
jgi:arylsulfatase A-like enzyme